MNIMEKQNTSKRSDTKNPPKIRIESQENSGRNVYEELVTPLHTSLGTDLEELGGKLENSIVQSFSVSKAEDTSRIFSV